MFHTPREIKVNKLKLHNPFILQPAGSTLWYFLFRQLEGERHWGLQRYKDYKIRLVVKNSVPLIID